jgi:hypothetical protein
VTLRAAGQANDGCQEQQATGSTNQGISPATK